PPPSGGGVRGRVSGEPGGGRDRRRAVPRRSPPPSGGGVRGRVSGEPGGGSILTAESYSFWLVPEEPVERELATLVRALAPVFGMPAFPPHATVQGDLDLAADDAEMLARELVEGGAPLAWRAWGIQ